MNQIQNQTTLPINLIRNQNIVNHNIWVVD